MQLPSLIWLNRNASVGSITSPQNTPGMALQASIDPMPVPQPVTTKSAALELSRMPASSPFIT